MCWHREANTHTTFILTQYKKYVLFTLLKFKINSNLLVSIMKDGEGLYFIISFVKPWQESCAFLKRRYERVYVSYFFLSCYLGKNLSNVFTMFFTYVHPSYTRNEKKMFLRMWSDIYLNGRLFLMYKIIIQKTKLKFSFLHKMKQNVSSLYIVLSEHTQTMNL